MYIYIYIMYIYIENMYVCMYVCIYIYICYTDIWCIDSLFLAICVVYRQLPVWKIHRLEMTISCNDQEKICWVSDWVAPGDHVWLKHNKPSTTWTTSPWREVYLWSASHSSKGLAVGAAGRFSQPINHEGCPKSVALLDFFWKWQRFWYPWCWILAVKLPIWFASFHLLPHFFWV